MELHTLLILSCLLVAGNAHENTSPSVSATNFLNSFHAQCIHNKHEITSLIFKETLQVLTNMAEPKKYSTCYTSDVTGPAYHGPEAMYLYNNENNTQQILTTFNDQSASSYMTCLLHHQTNIAETAFVAMAVCADIYDKNGPVPAVTSVTCLEKTEVATNLTKWAGKWSMAFTNGVHVIFTIKPDGEISYYGGKTVLEASDDQVNFPSSEGWMKGDKLWRDAAWSYYRVTQDGALEVEHFHSDGSTKNFHNLDHYCCSGIGHRQDN